jgi:MFS family permease
MALFRVESAAFANGVAVPTNLSAARALTPFYLVEFLGSFSCTLVLVCVPYWIKTGPLEGNVAQSLWQSAAWGLLYIPYALLSGKLVDKWGPRTLLIRAASLSVITSLAGLAAIFNPNLWLLFLGLTVFNFSSTQCWPALESAVARVPVKISLTSRMSMYNITWASGGFLAFFVADLVMGPQDNRHWPLIFIVPSIACLIGAIIAITATIPQSLLVSGHPAAHEHDPDSAHATVTDTRKFLLIAWIANTMAYVAGNVLIAVMPRVSTDYASLGSIWTFVRIGGFLAWFIWPGWHYKLRYMLAAYVLLIAGFFTLLFFAGDHGTPLPILIAGQAAFGLSASFIYASALYYAMHVSSGGGSHAGMHEALIGLGIGTGCAVGAFSLSFDLSTLHPLAYAVTTILAAGFITISVITLRKPRAMPSTPL